MSYISGKLCAGSETILDPIDVEITINQVRHGLSSWYGHFVVPDNRVFKFSEHKTCKLELEDGRRGTIIPVVFSRTAVYFRGSGPLKTD